jgi:hypothetical protein
MQAVALYKSHDHGRIPRTSCLLCPVILSSKIEQEDATPKCNIAVFIFTKKLRTAGALFLIASAAVLTLNIVSYFALHNFPNCYGVCRPPIEEYFRGSGTQTRLFVVVMMDTIGILMLLQEHKDRETKIKSF